MTAVSTMTGWVVVPGGEMTGAVSVELTCDPSWAPFVQATVTLPDVPGLAALLDPRTGARVLVGIRRAWAGRPTLAEMTSEWSGLTLADLTSEWSGLTLADLTTGWTVEWESGDRLSEDLVCDLAVRARRIDHGQGTITIKAASDELLAQGKRVTVSRPVEPLPVRVLAVLAAAHVPVERAELSAGDIFIAMPALTLDPSRSVWDELAAEAASVGLRLWCDEQRCWHLSDPGAAPVGSIEVTRVTGGTDDIDLDGEFADALAVTCNWTAADGQTRLTQTRTWPDPIPDDAIRVEAWTLDVATPGDSWPGPTNDELATRLAKRQTQGRTQQITAPLDPTARPGLTITTGAPSLPETTGRIGAVTFAVPADSMTLSIIDTTEEA